MGGLRRAARNHPLTLFYVLTLVLSWLPAPLTGGSLLPHGPFLAAVLVLALTEGRRGLAELFGRMAKWRVSWYWYLIAPGLVIGYLLVAFALNLLLGARIAETAHLRSAGVVAGLALELLIFGGQWEEPGWTGYALPWLQGRYAGRPYGLLMASLHLGALRALWHLPLVIYGHIPWFDLVFLSMALQFLVTWLFNRTRGSVLIVMLAHLTSNVVGGGLMVPLFAGADFTRFYILFIAVAWLVALLLVRRGGWSMGRRMEGEPETPKVAI